MKAALVAVAVGALLLAGCGAQDGNTTAGTRISRETGTGTGTNATSNGALPPPSPVVLAKANLAPCPTSDLTATALPDGLPDLTLACLGAGPGVKLSGLRGKPVVVNLWGSWCGPCAEELPYFAQVSVLAGSAVQFLGIDTLETRSLDGPVELLAASGVRYPSVRDDDKASQPSLRWLGLPHTVFVRPDGTIAFAKAGQIRSTDELRALIQQHLNVSVPSS